MKPYGLVTLFWIWVWCLIAIVLFVPVALIYQVVRLTGPECVRKKLATFLEFFEHLLLP